MAAYQHVIEPRVKVIQIRGINQKDNPQYDPGASTATGIDPGYEGRVGIDRLGKANEITYYLTNSLNAKTVAGPDQQPVRWEMVRFTLSQTFKMDPVSQPFKDLYADLTIAPTKGSASTPMPGTMSTGWACGRPTRTSASCTRASRWRWVPVSTSRAIAATRRRKRW